MRINHGQTYHGNPKFQGVSFSNRPCSFTSCWADSLGLGGIFSRRNGGRRKQGWTTESLRSQSFWGDLFLNGHFPFKHEAVSSAAPLIGHWDLIRPVIAKELRLRPSKLGTEKTTFPEQRKMDLPAIALRQAGWGAGGRRLLPSSSRAKGSFFRDAEDEETTIALPRSMNLAGDRQRFETNP